MEQERKEQIEEVVLPMGLYEKLKGNKEYYEIRLESIGGLGANLCGKMLGELGIKYLDLNSTNFSSYGSEKTGTPVKGFIRYCRKDKEIRIHFPVVKPDLLVIFHQALLEDASVMEGVNADTAVIVALEEGQKTQETKARIGEKIVRGQPVFGVEAQRIAMETHSRINVVMLGAIMKVMGIQDLKVGERIMEDTLGKKYPDALKANVDGMRCGYEQVHLLKIEGRGEEHTKKKDTRLPKWGYEDAPIGGINPCFGNSVISDLSPSRQGYIPLFFKEKCIHCGLCFSTCPDMVFQFKEGEYNGGKRMINQGLDYKHCKGCLRCVAVCPVGALEKGVEARQAKAHDMPNQELLRKPDHYEKTGADAYVIGESFLSEKRVEGGRI